jgi:hypothetical protein
MILFYLYMKHQIALLLMPLWSGVHIFRGTWLRCNSLEWVGHSASLRLALHREKRTLHPIQLPFPG